MFLLSSTDFFFKRNIPGTLFYLFAYPQCIGHFMISFVALTNAVLAGILHITIITSFANSRIYKHRVIFVVRRQTVLIQI